MMIRLIASMFTPDNDMCPKNFFADMKENREQCYKRLTTDGRKISSLIDESQKLFHAMVRTQIFAEVTHIDNRNEK